ncbi:cation diffusion facilitator family transporter [Enterococcus caccae]|uniref:Cation diffusion facilitator family transporter n=1 Tax=Enterococcus caccae ATCC BAA-1240 TaxID=1158612 RepID=R3WJQ1_9ENTE|nr:cation diffusion facilitator family transporter [Enterococcus caccae]EOL47677.1 cation diffusion facilitator family transporter [Enterococcus caccae ATCC BAA-1240]EOT65475.1 cation efflux family protein [Enterococcus caccae ATCC BAA-1240]OJG27346.1 cation diffusion facilitator family transporter [Enterococcus caccae]
MINFLIGHFEKRQTKNADTRTAFGVFAGVVGLLSNLLLFVGKFLIGLVSGSVSIMADAMNNLSDTVSSVLTLVGFYIAGKPADKEHPYGHERFEYISGMLVSLLITFVGFQFFMTSIQRIKTPQSIHVTPVILVILILSILIKVWQSVFYKRVAQKIDSNTLVATAKDSLNDVFTTIAVLVSATVEGVTGLKIDGIVGLIIACYIIFSGLQLIREFVNELMGLRPDQAAIDKMKLYLSSVSDIVGYHDLLIHQYGPNKTFASVHIEIDDRWDLTRAHETIDEIELVFKQKLGVDLVCHIDPVNLYDQRQQFIHQELKKIIKGIDNELKGHDIRLVEHGNKPRILFDLVVPNHFKATDQELKIRIQEQVYRNIGDYPVEVTFDHNYLL